MAKQTLTPQQAFWTYRADSATPTFDEIPAGAFCGTEDEWSSLSPGMRREARLPYALPYKDPEESGYHNAIFVSVASRREYLEHCRETD